MSGTTEGRAEWIAVELQKARSVAGRLFGDDYARKVAPWRKLVRDLAEAWKCSPVEVPPRLHREGSMPENPLMLLAAVVDETQGEEAPRG